MTEEQRSELVALLRKPPPEDPKVAFGTLHPYLKGMASPPTALQALRVAFPKPKCRAALDGDPWRWWELLGLYYLDLGPSRWHDAFGIFAALYDYMHAAQRKLGRLHKGMPLCWMADCSYYLNHPFHARRYLVLTLCEDALSRAQDSDHDMGGSYWRLVMRDGVADGDYRACVREIGALSREDPESCAFAEWALQRLERSKWLTRPRARHTGWLSVTPSVMEAGLYRANPRYIRYLRKRGSDASGTPMESLAAYLLGCMPGCRTKLRVHSYGPEHDVVCTMEGVNTDFRSELGRYFLCECKDKAEAADFPEVARFCRVLQSVKARFGVVFSAKHVTGRDKRVYADGERLKLYHESGIVVVVVDDEDLGRLERGASFTEMLRDKYERVRLDLPPVRPARKPRAQPRPGPRDKA